MKYKILNLLIPLLCFSLTAIAQKSEKGVVYLKNGSIVRGALLSQDPGQPVKIKTSDNNIWVFERTAIDSISQKNRQNGSFKTGCFNLTEAGVLAWTPDNAYNAPFTFMNISGWQFANGLSAGVGAGVEFFSEAYLPVVADLRYYFGKQGVLPFIGAQGGYSIALGKADKQYVYNYAYDYNLIWPGPIGQAVDVDARGGWLVNPSVGICAPIGDKLALTVSAGYRIMRHRYNREDNYKLDVDYNRLSLKVGLMFK